ncbi:Reverse transcriptase domain-containing protein [Aphis craccivora]|uniref:Reverse transcriptase domain-containing protein n=1 Tax=Aphis craccivora TaxID=307492 RepID=A0A6G0W1I9_APHCR|nr:Reverse transcriptase domain-containing protein [Aphis craccivora]
MCLFNLSGYYQNVRSLNNKLNNLICNIQCEKYDFLMLTETWLKSEMRQNGGGGVVIIVNNKYTCELIQIPYGSIEQVFVLMKINDVQKVILGTCYIPETSPLSVYETHTDTISWLFSRFDDKTNILIAGDYNFRGTTFSCNNTGLTIDGNRSAAVNIIYDCFSVHNLSQYNCIRNSYGNILDLIFTNLNLISVKLCSSLLVTINKPHPPLNIICEFYKCNNLSIPTKTYRNFRKINFDNVSIALNKINWCNLFSCMNVDAALQRLQTFTQW